MKDIRKYNKLLKNTTYVFLGNAGSKLVGIFMLPLYTRWLSVSEYGTTDLIIIYATLISGVISFCIADAIFVFPKDKPFVEQSQYLSSALFFLLTSLLITGTLFIVMNELSSTFFIRNTFFDYLFLVYLLALVTIFQNLTQQFCRSIGKMITYSVTGVVVTISTALYAFLLIPLWNINGFVVSIVMAHLTGALYCFFSVKMYRYLSYSCVRRNRIIELLHFSIPLIPNCIIWWLINSMNRPLLEKYSGIHEIGLYAVANKFPGVLQMILVVFMSAWGVSVLDEFGKKGYNDFYNKIFKLFFVACSFALTLITLLSKPIITIFTTPDYYDAWLYMPILTTSMLFTIIASFVGTNFTASKETQYFFYSSIIPAVCAAALNFILIPQTGIWGATISTTISCFLMASMRISYSSKYVKIENMSIYIYLLAINLFLYFALILTHNLLIIFGLGFIAILMEIITIRKEVFQLLQYIRKKYNC